MTFQLGTNPKYYLEHTFRHLEDLLNELQTGSISSEEYHQYRRELKEQYLLASKDKL